MFQGCTTENTQVAFDALNKIGFDWDYHDRPRTGVLRHVSKSGDVLFTVRAGTQRQMDVFTIRKLADIGDDFADGHVRFTTRSNIEYMVTDEAKVAPMIVALEAEGFPVGGTGASVLMISHTQGWLHCDIPGTDASGVVKGMMDMLHKEFVQEKMPNRLRITTSCCQINCGGQGDIAINVQYTKPPNNAPHWPEVKEVVGRIVKAYKSDAKHWERMGEWIDRIGWNGFFEMTELTFTKHHLDTWTGARKTINTSAHLHF